MATLQRRRPPAPPIRPAIAAPAPGQPANSTSTIGGFILEQIKAGVDPVNAAATVGVSPAEFMAWMRDGAETAARLHAGADWYKDFTPDQQDAALFADDVIRSHGTHIARLSIILEQAAQGGLTRTTTRTKSAGGQVVEQVTTVETLLPDVDVARWKLEKLEPGVYGSRATLNVNVTDMTDTAATADMLEKRMMQVAAALAGAIETTATENRPLR